MKDLSICVVGGGSWATAIVKMLCENVKTVKWHMRSSYSIEYLKKNKHNPSYLSSVEFNLKQLVISDDINEIVKDSDYVILATPSVFLQGELEKLNTPLKDKIIFSAIKGIIPETNEIIADYLNRKFDVSYDNIGVITGPCHAEEVAMERLSYVTVACTDSYKTQIMANAISCDYIKTTLSDDIFGTEYATVLKNIYAITAGVCHGLGYGDNFQAVLMSNAIRETDVFIKAIHPMKRNINNSAYLGDLLVTGYSFFSRNRMFGTMIGKGYTVRSAKLEMKMIAEGYFATKGIYKIAKKHKLNMPIVTAIYKILYDKRSPKKIIIDLTDKLD